MNVWQKGSFCTPRLVAHGGKGVSVRGLGGGPTGEMGIWRFLHNRKVTIAKMLSPARADKFARRAPRPVRLCPERDDNPFVTAMFQRGAIREGRGGSRGFILSVWRARVEATSNCLALLSGGRR
jgi:hypothetical protein